MTTPENANTAAGGSPVERRVRRLGGETRESMYCTDTETLKARKTHLCMNCGELVAVGEKYKRWRCYDSGDVGTVKMHPECYAAHCKSAEGCGGGPWEFTPFSHPRGEAVDA